MNRHKHADLIIQWANGVEVEANAKINQGGPFGWTTVKSVCLFDNDEFEFRLKPKEKEWYESIPDHGVLCWVWDKNEHHKRIDIVYSYQDHEPYSYNYRGRFAGWINAIPLTNDEIERFKR